jgi:putative lipoic acid-binding regulatory protein
MNSLKDALDAEYKWPCPYTFKFVIPATKKEKILSFFPAHLVEWKDSRSGKYLSLTCTQTMMSSDEVIAIYQEVKDNIPEAIGL